MTWISPRIVVWSIFRLTVAPSSMETSSINSAGRVLILSFSDASELTADGYSITRGACAIVVSENRLFQREI